MKRALAFILAMTLAGCVRTVHTTPPNSGPRVAPIAAGQVSDLLSPDVRGKDGNLFVSVAPDWCSGIAREVDPPFISDHHPAAATGGHWDAEDSDTYVEEMVGVFPAGFDARGALADANRTVEKCRGQTLRVTSMRGQTYVFDRVRAADSGSPDIVSWSLTGPDWACDSVFVAAHNAAVGISACGPVNGYDVLGLADDALKRIERLANTTM